LANDFVTDQEFDDLLPRVLEMSHASVTGMVAYIWVTVIHEELLARCHLVDEAEAETALRGFDSGWKCLSPREQSRILELLIERVEFNGESGQVSIMFRSTGFHGLIERLAQENLA
jgi:hypothetical protein